MKRFVEFIKYTWKAKGRHGIHSPFVYDLVDRCFQISMNDMIQSSPFRTKQQGKKSLRLLLQLVKYLEVSELVSNYPHLKDLKSVLEAHELNCTVHQLSTMDTTALQHTSLVYFSMENTNNSDFEALQIVIKRLNEQTLIVVDGIRKTAENQQDWQKIISLDSIHFTADLYSFGMLSKRPQQEKEHFVLRY